MPQPKGDLVLFVVHQRQDDPTEIVAHLVKPNGLEDLKAYMLESGYKLCESTRTEPFKAMTGETFYIRLIGDLIVNTFGNPSYRRDRLQLKWLRNRVNRKDFFGEGVYRGRFQADYSGKVLLHRLTVHAGTINRGSGRQFTLNNLESILGDVVSSSKLIIPKEREDPAPPEIQESFTDEEVVKDVVLRTISKDIPKDYVVPLAMHLFGLSEVEILNLSLLPHHRDFDEQRYAVLEKWMLTSAEEATFTKLIEAFRAVKMTSAAINLNRNLLTNERLRSIAKGLPGDLQPLADTLKVDLEESRQNYVDELNDHKFQILYRWREDSFETLNKRASHTKLLQAMRKCGMELAADRCTIISSVDARDVVLLRIISKDASRETIYRLVRRLGLTEEQIDGFTREHGQDFNKKLFLLNSLVAWRDSDGKGEGARFEDLMYKMEEVGLRLNADILDEELVKDKRLKFAASQIENDMMQPLADKLRVDTKPMMIQYDGDFIAELGYRLLVRWKETRGKYASHTELLKALESVGLGAVGLDVDKMGSVDISTGAMCDFCLRYVTSWIHVSRAHEWPSVVQNIPSNITEGLDRRTVDLIKRQQRDPCDQMARALATCRDRGVFKTAGALVNRLVTCGFEKAALMLLDVSRSQYYCTTLRLEDV
ncbi:uncharacterized protein LOC110983050 [Acanthaster planci]|uniref:Uncharacterized protein LOC110983050 n=1 Tax=Acanthaster planci TaxID=133434 RepID=A0A8B7YZE3_ACAPL|nr:uncharacterized protein LOC110983050 [Acanthaster planci]XP_022098904.1 uncharacterized protein LOC110983050 [Acanthaster planci]XP_022099743.1 uncharacterized protein LOC110983050 [Acanthaster planci]